MLGGNSLSAIFDPQIDETFAYLRLDPQLASVGHGLHGVKQEIQQQLLHFGDYAVERRELFETVKVQSTNCLGPCRSGPTIVVYPENTWYGGVREADVEEIVQSHFIDGRRVDRLVLKES